MPFGLGHSVYMILLMVGVSWLMRNPYGEWEMEPNIAEFSRSNSTIDNFSDCHRKSCQLRIVGDSGCEECLMESVRSEWAMPSAANYCKDPVSRRFVDNLHLKL